MVDKIPPFPMGGRQSGRTQWMIDRLVEAVTEGQPFCRVVAHNTVFSKYLRNRVCKSLQKAGLPILHLSNFRIETEGSKIEFVSALTESAEKRRGEKNKAREFWDHFADGVW